MTRVRRRGPWSVGRGVVAAALLGVTLSVSLAAAPAVQDASRLRAGLFLYASPGLRDPRFAETVVLLIQHGDEGSMGVVVNRPSDIPLRKTLPELSEARRLETPVYWGGPVQPEAILALIRSPRSGMGARMVVPDVYLTADLDVLRTALAEPRPDRAVRVYSGYAGWSPGQLAGEYRRGDWILDRADASAVFAPDPSLLWDKVRALMERREARDRRVIVPARSRIHATVLL